MYHGLALRHAAGGDLGRGAGFPGGRGSGGGGQGEQHLRLAGPGGEHPPEPPVRQKFRVLLRGPAAHRQVGRGDGAGHPVPGRGRHGQALCLQQQGDQPEKQRLSSVPAGHAGNLPESLRDHCPGGPALGYHELLQHYQWPPGLGEPGAADGYPAL